VREGKDEDTQEEVVEMEGKWWRVGAYGEVRIFDSSRARRGAFSQKAAEHR